MKQLFCVLCVALLLSGCSPDEPVLPNPIPADSTKKDSTFTPTPYNLIYPTIKRNGYFRVWPRLVMPANNPLTVEGVALGKKLFFDSLLSATNTIACASCHLQTQAFADNKRFSVGVEGRVGTRNSMPLFNLGWAEMFNQTPHRFFWDGRKASMEDQVLGPIGDPLEMNQDLAELVIELRAKPEYPPMFKKAFGSDSITIKGLMMAIAQFERTLISGNSKFDKYLRFEADLTEQELNGYAIYSTEGKGDCFHCHAVSPLFTDFSMRNNGLDSVVEGKGLGAITGNPLHMGMFKTPSLRNLSFTAPYMHDGRFNTLEEVVEFYNSQTKDNPTTDAAIRKHFKEGGLNLTNKEKADLVAFLKTLNDEDFLTNPNFK